jgi:hypothetical protein
MSPNGHGEPIEVTERPLFLLVTRLLLMSHRENQHDIVGRLFSELQAAWDSRKARVPSTTRTSASGRSRPVPVIQPLM